MERQNEGGRAGWQRVRWGAVFAGLIVAIVTQFLLGVLGLAVGLTALEPREGAPGAGFGWGAAIWASVSLLISLFIGGWLAGRLSGFVRAADGALNGVLVWALSLLAMVYLVSTGVGSLVSGVFGVVGTAAQTAATVAGQGAVARAGSGRDLASQAREAARQAGIDVGRIQQEAQQQAQHAQESAQRIGQSGTTENQQARETAAKAAGYAATGAWSLLVASLVGLGVAAWGGAAGARGESRRTVAA